MELTKTNSHNTESKQSKIKVVHAFSKENKLALSPV